MELEVIGAGLGRTGTLSLRAALETLGYGPCHHMKVVLVEDPGTGPLWEQVAEGDLDVLKEIYKGFKATVDYPGCIFYEQFMEWNPQAKVILSVRDNPEVWEQSCRATIFEPNQAQMFRTLLKLPLGPVKAGKAIRKLVRAIHGVDPDEEETDLQKMYKEWNQDVIDTVAKYNLLVFNVKDGWQPLCQFLGVPVPDIPFPRVNDRQEFKDRVSKMKLANTVLEAVIASVVVGCSVGVLAVGAMYLL